MTRATRANVVSSFTVVKGAMIDETYTVFAAWDFDRSKRENLDHLRAENFIGARSATWLRDVAKVLNRRFDPAGRDRPLVLLAKHGLPLHEWKPLLLWHMTRDEFLVRDFLQSWLFSAYDEGRFRVRTEDVETYLGDVGTRGGTTEHVWSEQTTKRVAAGLLKIAIDFGLLRGSVSREFAPLHLPERSFLYLLLGTRAAHVVEVAMTDHATAAPLGMARWFWVADAAGARRLREPYEELAAAVADRSSTAVKAALKSLLDTGVVGQRRKSKR